MNGHPGVSAAALAASAGWQRETAGVADAEALGRVARLHGPHELRAALLALLWPLPVGPARAAAWAATSGATPALAGVLDDVDGLPQRLRLPCFEVLLSRLARQPLAERQALLGAARRMMREQGAVRPIDRLRWLAMRQRLGDRGGLDLRSPTPGDWPSLAAGDIAAIAACTAHLSRLVPVDDPTGRGEAGTAWYAAVMAPWRDEHGAPPSRRLPDADALVNALQNLQALPWMQRPMIVRAWVEAAFVHAPPGSRGSRGSLTETAADGLRLVCRLLDSPLPPALAACHGTLADDAAR